MWIIAIKLGNFRLWEKIRGLPRVPHGKVGVWPV